MKRLFGHLSGFRQTQSGILLTIVNQQGVPMAPPATYKTTVHYDTADDDGLARYSITLKAADFTVLHTGDQYSLLHDRQQFSHSLLRVRRIDKVEVATFNTGEIRHQTLVDAMRVDDDPALGGLAEDLGRAHDRHSTRSNDVGQNLPWPDRRQLIDIADE
jgi:hypothetical protein